ncbi:MAG: LacI family transcriptional regulator [Chloroflexi bacterium]|nr:LacI family transcriptional regulator [Chloroflexota bacterium]
MSIATVSRALNGHHRVSEETRLIVLQAAHDLGYSPPRLCHTPQLSRSVLVLTREEAAATEDSTPAAGGEFERRVWVAVHSYLVQRGIAARLQHSTVTPEEAQLHASDIGVSGLVLLGGVRERIFVQELLSVRIPFVIAGAHLRPMEVNCVMADVGDGTRQAMQHLVERGRRQIGFVNGPPTTTTSAEKMDAYRLSLIVHGLPFTSDRVVVSDFSAESGYRQTRRLLQQITGLDAVIFADDVIALGGMRAIREFGYSVPDDLAVIGFGDYELARFVSPTLTSVQFDMNMMGIIAARRLCMLFDTPDDYPWLIRVPTTLVVRGST